MYSYLLLYIIGQYSVLLACARMPRRFSSGEVSAAHGVSR